jgi:anti-sigma B factor antagonist
VTGSDLRHIDFDRSGLRLLCRQVGDHTVVVSVTGELDMATVPQLGAYLRDKTASHPAHLVLDLSGVAFLASSGVGLLMAAHDGQDGVHGELHLTGVAANRAVYHVMEVAGVLARFDIHDDEDDLLRRLAR